MDKEADAIPTMQVIKGATKVTINVSDLAQFEKQGFKRLSAPQKSDAGKSDDKGE